MPPRDGHKEMRISQLLTWPSGITGLCRFFIFVRLSFPFLFTLDPPLLWYLVGCLPFPSPFNSTFLSKVLFSLVYCIFFFYIILSLLLLYPSSFSQSSFFHISVFPLYLPIYFPITSFLSPSPLSTPFPSPSLLFLFPPSRDVGFRILSAPPSVQVKSQRPYARDITPASPGEATLGHTNKPSLSCALYAQVFTEQVSFSHT